MVHLKPEIFTNCQSIIFELISTIFMIIASILIIIQGFDNDNLRNYKSREIKTERLLFSQFSHEVFSNIESSPFQNSSNNQGSVDLTAELKFNNFFDCRGVKDDELNEEICQDRIIKNNWTCCRAECCLRSNGGKSYCYDYNFDLKNPNIYNNKILSYDAKEYFEDPRRRLCTYYNQYYGDIKKFLNKNIKIKRLSFNYEKLLLNNLSSFCISIYDCPKEYIDCGIIDTLNRHLYASNGNLCPVNDIILDKGNIILENSFESGSNQKRIILRNIISEIPPLVHEYKNKIICNDEGLTNEEITIRDINKLLKNNKNIYRKLENIEIPLNLIGNGVKIENKMNKNSKLYWYTTNYIGFNTLEDLQKFKKYFNKSDHTNNCLFKVGRDIYPYIKPIIIMFPLLAIFLYYIIFLILVLFEKILSIKKRNMIHFIIRVIILTAMFIIECIFYLMVTKEFEKIEIDMDENYKEILDLYNKRRNQLKYFLSIIFLILAFVSTIIFFFANCELSKKNLDIINDDIINNNDKKDAILNDDNNNINENQNRVNNNIIDNRINIIQNQDSDRLQLKENRNQKINNNINTSNNFINNNESNNIQINKENLFHSQTVHFSINQNVINNENDNKEQPENNIINEISINYSQRFNSQNIINNNDNYIHNDEDQKKDKDQPEFNDNIPMKSNNKEALTLKQNRKNSKNVIKKQKSFSNLNQNIKIEKPYKKDKKLISESNHDGNKVNMEDFFKENLISDNGDLISKSANSNPKNN